MSGGKGTRLRPLTYTGAKQLVPLANKPVLFYVLEDLVAAGVDDLGIVVGDTAAQVEEAVGDGSRFGCQVTYIPQDRPAGLAHAVRAARGYLGDNRFVMYLGDTVIQGGIKRYVDEFANSDSVAHLLLHPVPNPQDFGVATLDGGRLTSLEEKPIRPRSDLALIGIYFFGPEIHPATAEVRPSWRGELEITDAIRVLLDAGHCVKPFIHDGWWIDTGKMEDILKANRLLLMDAERRIEGAVAEDCLVQGTVVIEPRARVVGSTLCGPLIIGAGSLIENAYLGPFSSVGANCTVRNSEVEHTIVMERSRILDVPHRIADSLIGRDVTVTRSPSLPAARLMLGDHSKVEFL